VWRFTGGGGACPDAEALARARALVGFGGIELDAARRTVRFLRPGMLIDLGSAGKGYAVDRAIARLRENGVRRALLHGGTSSVHAIGVPDGAEGWRIAWRAGRAPARTFELHDSALAVSAIHGKAFRVDGRVFGHVMDPRSGEPADVATSAVVTGPDSLLCDALSTALLVGGARWLPHLSERFPGYSAMVA
jgi:thiamine biosynthesis lipoprotein